MNDVIDISYLLELIDKVKGAYNKMCEPIIEKFNIPKVEFDIIMFLENNKQYYTAKDISNIKKIKPNVVSLHVDKLVMNGYLERQVIENDRRKIKLVCTSKTKDIVLQGHMMQKKFYETITNKLTKEDMKSFKRYFDIVYNNADFVNSNIERSKNND